MLFNPISLSYAPICVRNQKLIDPSSTAVVVIDMWNKHWCKTYTKRVSNMVPRMNEAIEAARRLGLQIVFAPSDVMDFYENYPQRRKMQAIPSHPLPEDNGFEPPEEPVGKGCCECGPDQPCITHSNGHWTRQHPDLIVAEDDLIGDCNNERELVNFCQQRGIDTLIYMGVASNMCVIRRQFGMVNMRRYGLNVLFVSDLVQASTANGIDPEKKTPDPNFTPAKGSSIVQRYLESHVGPSMESRQLIDAAGMSLFADDKRPHIVFVVAENEYLSKDSIPKFAREYLEKDFHYTLLYARSGEGRNDVPGLDAMYDADLLVLSMRRRALPVVQMDHLEHYIRSGKPIVAIRVSIVPFQVGPDERPDGHVIWQDFDKEVLGCNYQAYNPKSREVGSDIWIVDESISHPITSGLNQTGFHSASWLYKLNPLADSTTLLTRGRWSEDDPDEPVAFTNTYQGGRVFYTSLGHPDDFEDDFFCKLLANAISWAVGT